VVSKSRSIVPTTPNEYSDTARSDESSPHNRSGCPPWRSDSPYLACGLDGKSWNDAAIIGLMAMHALKGKLYAFFWGQSYMGSTESLSIAPFFALFGVQGDSPLHGKALPRATVASVGADS
jgi:hypothetical protein